MEFHFIGTLEEFITIIGTSQNSKAPQAKQEQPISVPELAPQEHEHSGRKPSNIAIPAEILAKLRCRKYGETVKIASFLGMHLTSVTRYKREGTAPEKIIPKLAEYFTAHESAPAELPDFINEITDPEMRKIVIEHYNPDKPSRAMCLAACDTIEQMRGFLADVTSRK
jgi:hypothetical protein